jgi:hypothetical protein
MRVLKWGTCTFVAILLAIVVEAILDLQILTFALFYVALLPGLLASKWVEAGDMWVFSVSFSFWMLALGLMASFWGWRTSI